MLTPKEASKLGNATPKGYSVLQEVYAILQDREEAQDVARAFVRVLKKGETKAFLALFARQDGPVPKEVRLLGGERVKAILFREAIEGLQTELSELTNGEHD